MAKVAMIRNQTSFPVRIGEYLKALDFSTPETHQYSFLKYYQNLVRVFFEQVDVGAKGLLVNHTMGLGKSIIAVALAMDQLEAGRPVLFLLYKSLMGNLRDSITKYIKLRTAVEPSYRLGTIPPDDLDRYIDRTFQFVSMNAGNMMRQIYRKAQNELSREFAIAETERQLEGVIKSGSLDGKTVIIDEAQNLFRAITNGAKNATAFYKLAMESTDLRLVFLSGTPVSSDPFELVACFNMIGSREPNHPILPEAYTDFCKYFVDPATGHLKNRAKFQNRIMGLTSYVTHTHSIAKNSDGSSVAFPQDLGIQVITVEMTANQFTYYQFARDREIEEQKRPGGVAMAKNMSKPRGGKSSSYRQRSRQLSNFCPPKQFVDQKFSTIDTSKISASDSESPKFIAILEKINHHKNTPGIVYSQFVGAGGLGAFARYLEFHGYQLDPSLAKYTRSLRFGDESFSDQISDTQLSEEFGDDPPPMPLPKVEDVRMETISPEDVVNQPLVPGVDVSGASPRRTPIAPSRESHSKYLHFVSPPEPDLDGIRSKFSSTKYQRTVSGLPMGEPVPSVLSLRRHGGESDYNDDWIERYFGIEELRNDGTVGGGTLRRFAFITGDIPAEARNHLLARANSESNRDGSDIALLLISSTGAEGIDLKGFRHVHILEPYWNWARISQVKARAIRNDSHIGLPASEQNVQTYVYLAVPPKIAQVSEPSTDVDLWTESLKNRDVVESFLSSVHETAIECSLIDNLSLESKDPSLRYQCRVCNPDDLPLFIDDIDQDMKTPDKCSPIRKQKVTAREVLVNGRKYYHTVDLNSPYGFTLYEFLPDLNAYRPVPMDDRVYLLMEDLEVE